MGFGQGTSGTNGNGLQFLIILIVELYGGTSLLSMARCIAENAQRLNTYSGSGTACRRHFSECSDCGSLDTFRWLDPHSVLWHHNTLPNPGQVLEVLAI